MTRPDLASIVLDLFLVSRYRLYSCAQLKEWPMPGMWSLSR